MTVSIGTSRLGFPRATAETVHSEMKLLRGHLLAVGLVEMPTAVSYDASPLSTKAGVPTVDGTWSQYMYFALADEAQLTYPVYICIRVGYGAFFNNYVGKPRVYAMQVAVTRVLQPDGTPSTISDITSFGMSAYVRSNQDDTLGPLMSLGDFVSFNNGTLLISFGTSAQVQISSGTTHSGPIRDSLFLLLCRQGSSIAVYNDRKLENMNSLPIYQPLLVMDSLVSNTYKTISNGETRAGNIFLDNGVPVISPVYGINGAGDVAALPGVYTIPAVSASNGQTLSLDFTGVERTYLCLNKPNTLPGNKDQHWLIEWQ